MDAKAHLSCKSSCASQKRGLWTLAIFSYRCIYCQISGTSSVTWALLFRVAVSVLEPSATCKSIYSGANLSGKVCQGSARALLFTGAASVHEPSVTRKGTYLGANLSWKACQGTSL